MERYKIKSSFCVAGQLVHVDVVGKVKTFSLTLPIKFAPALCRGGQFDVFESKIDGRHIAYRFKNQLLFATPLENKTDAKNILREIAGLRCFSVDKLLLKYSVLMAMQNSAMMPGFSITTNMVKLSKENQR